MKTYLDFLETTLTHGRLKKDRTGIGTRSLFGYQMRFNLTAGFPLLTTKRLHFKSILHELLWFLQGETNINALNAVGVRIWDEWANENGELGPIYGKQWRAWPTPNGKTIDQLAQLLVQIKTQPDSRRLIVSAWNVADIPQMALPPCHVLFQFYVSDHKLSCQLYQRSADVFLGVPFNIASYSLLTHMIAQQCDLIPDEFIWVGGDCHLYLNHVEQAKTQLSRIPHPLPTLQIKRKPKTLFDYCFEDFSIQNYYPDSKIKAPIAV